MIATFVLGFYLGSATMGLIITWYLANKEAK